MKFSTSEYFIKEVYTSFKRNTWMTLASVLTVVISLFILGFFSIVVLNLNKLADTLESQVQVSVYLKDNINEDDLDDTKKILEAVEGTQKVNYITRDEAMQNFKDRLGDQQFLLDALDNTNPLPNSFTVIVSAPEILRRPIFSALAIGIRSVILSLSKLTTISSSSEPAIFCLAISAILPTPCAG